ncbi:TonB-dependent receptor [Asticcacaulis endophyticus]|uniref:TonB-dependent receptor n=1 Tax=Asticcacaulis endophyticus TaxID=1395890 RepID=A0A918QAJ7_9CAUL|nr:TonB-dependent receptor [Asticcacaulis endophyticus]GGZ39104.1 TonB-dependent receptor [Asticcacaulis endophyticus]
MKLSLVSAVNLIALLSYLPAQADAPLGPDDADAVTEVVVTGEKTRRSLQNTQSSVAVTTTKKIQDENIQNFYDVVQRTANMSETYGPTGFTIRGISNLNVSGGGAGSLATIYVDGAALPERAVYSGPLEMWDVGQIEIFRGPQSTLQGKNALAGAVIIRSKDPTFNYEYKMQALVSDQGDRNISAAVGGPLIEDQVAFRLSADNRHSDGYIYNTTRHTQENPVKNLNLRGKLLFRPKAVDGLEVIATYAHNKFDSGYLFTYARTDVPDYYDNRINTSNYPNTNTTKTDIFTVEASYEISDRLTLSGVVSHNKFDTTMSYDQDSTEQDISYGTQAQLAKTWSQEARLNYRSERFTGLLGLYHSKRDSDADMTSLTNVTTPVPTIIGGLMLSGLDQGTATFIANLYAQALPVIPVDVTSQSPETVENTAVFADGSWHISPKLSVLGGLRYDREEYGVGTTQVAIFAGTLPNPANYPAEIQPAISGINALVIGQVSGANSDTALQTRTFEAWLPKLGVKYDFTDAMSLSFIAQRGYRSGGSVINQARSTVVAYDPEYTTNYEFSWRSAWLDNSLTVNANTYYIDWTDQQVNVNMGLNEFDYETKNAGKSHLYGFEVEVAQRLTSNFDWYGSVGYSKTEFDEFSVDQGSLVTDFSGKEFMYAPRWTVSAGGTWRGDNGLFANLNASYRAENYQGVDNDLKVKARTLINTKLGYDAGAWAAYIYANNLLDEKYSQYDRPDDGISLLGAPRTVGIILEANF